MARPVLVVLVKWPQPGRAKTRLARDIGTIDATWWARHQIAALVRRLGADPRWDLVLAVAPDARARGRGWPGRVPRVPQGPGDLGARMVRALGAAPPGAPRPMAPAARRSGAQTVPTTRARASGAPGPRLLIGADIPGIAPATIARAFHLVRGADWVLGPAPDGGYWLVGRRHAGLARRAGVMRGVRWSGPQALADTVRSLGPARIAWAAPMADIDTGADLARLRNRAGPRPPGG